MPSTQSNGLEIAYEESGPRDGRPLVLVMGLGASLVFWDDGFCEMLAKRGHRVIRFDNRDVGRSTKLDALGVPNVMEAMSALASGKTIAGPYLLSDMARDTIGLMDALGIERAHVVGASMGGMIVQTMAIEHPASPALDDFDHVVDRKPEPAPGQTRGDGVVGATAGHRARRIRRSGGRGLAGDRQPGFSLRRTTSTDARGRALRSRLPPPGRSPAARWRRRLRRSDGVVGQGFYANARDPRRRRPARPDRGREGHGGRRSGREPPVDRGHGTRHAAWGLAANRRRGQRAHRQALDCAAQECGPAERMGSRSSACDANRRPP